MAMTWGEIAIAVTVISGWLFSRVTTREFALERVIDERVTTKASFCDIHCAPRVCVPFLAFWFVLFLSIGIWIAFFLSVRTPFACSASGPFRCVPGPGPGPGLGRSDG